MERSYSGTSPRNARHKQKRFLALAEFDKPENGGNGDGVINRDMRSFAASFVAGFEPNESQNLTNFIHCFIGLKAFSLEFRLSQRLDQYGHEFRYRSKVREPGIRKWGNAAWDVFVAH